MALLSVAAVGQPSPHVASVQGLSIPDYFTKYTTANGHGPVNTASGSFNDIANSIFHTAAAVSLIVTLFLDNTIPGTEVMGASNLRGAPLPAQRGGPTLEPWLCFCCAACCCSCLKCCSLVT